MCRAIAFTAFLPQKLPPAPHRLPDNVLGNIYALFFAADQQHASRFCLITPVLGIEKRALSPHLPVHTAVPDIINRDPPVVAHQHPQKARCLQITDETRHSIYHQQPAHGDEK